MQAVARPRRGQEPAGVGESRGTQVYAAAAGRGRSWPRWH